MVKQNLELAVAFVFILLLTAAYLLSAASGLPGPSTLVGHGIGIVGFVLMLMTETLYSLRKRSRRFQWGRMQIWLSFHIFTGIVGPYMVFLHTGFRFAGLAGVAMWMTAVMVVSGFVGRYIFTAMPRTASGVEIEAPRLQEAINAIEAQLQAWLAEHPVQFQALADQMKTLPVVLGTGIAGLLSKPGLDHRYRQDWQRAIGHLDPDIRPQAVDLEHLLSRRRILIRQTATLRTARRLMALWHAAHVPLGLVLFTAAIAHVVAALYYS
ncbi:MAG: hypothetical protein JXA89_02390 [Anaerolineae bacterium]|nr:hypothetical protein [Anaerolineae bacterium]